MITIDPVAGAVGAEISGLKLDEPLDGASLAVLQRALLDYEVLFFRDQALSPAGHLALAAHFGDAELHGAYPHVDGHPALTILENDHDHPPDIDRWHSDITFRVRPPLGSILHGVAIPERGGDTLFASMSAAFDGLSDRMQQLLSGLFAEHDFSFGFKESLAAPGGRGRLARMVEANPPVRHPIVRIHSESGKRGLFVNPTFTSSICGMKPRESAALLRLLFEHMTEPEYLCRFRWRVNSVAFWDNRITQHRPVNDYWPAHRRMQRVTISDPCVPTGESARSPAVS
jgi:taurine dioxygenase